MKGCLLLSLWIFVNLAGMAQMYTVVRIRGIIYHNGKPLKEGNTFTDADRLNTPDPTAALRVLSNAQGSFVISFQSGKQKLNFPASKRSELFELVAGDYIRMLNPAKSDLVTKGADDFDWFNFFYRISSGNTSKKLLLLDDQHVSLSSTAFPAQTPYKLFACIMHTRDSVLTEIPIVNHEMIFKASAFPDSMFYWKLKIGYTDDGGKFKVSAIAETPITSRCLHMTAFDNMAAFFFTDWNRYYTDKHAAENAFRIWLNSNYGETMPGTVESIFQKYLP